jgi:hypothetical protein
MVALKLALAFSVMKAVDATTAADCHDHMYPYGKSKTAPYPTAAVVQCTSDKGAVKLDADADDSVTDDATPGGDAQAKTICCFAKPACSTSYKVSTDTTDATKTACPADTLVQATNLCSSVDKADTTKCGVRGTLETTWSDEDRKECCRMPCSAKWQLKDGGDTTKSFECDEGDFQVHTTAVCAADTCTAGDKATCCQKKCAKAVVLFGEDTSATEVDVACKSDTSDLISTSAFCTGATCKDTDTQCCQQKCSDGFVLNGVTDTSETNSGAAKLACDEGLLINTDAKLGFCAKTKCASSDAKTCCQTKCTAAKGYELFGGKTDGKFQCAKDLRVHPTGNCKGTDCKASGSVCCQQKCSAAFKLKGAAGTGTECGTGFTVHTTAYCKGSSCGSGDAGTCCQESCAKGFKLHGATTKEANTCAKDSTLADGKCVGSPCSATDAKLCCNEKCTDKKTGFKIKGASTKEPNECKAKETVATKGMCKGDCSSDDASSCCLKANTTATTDASSAGLASVVGLLVLLSTAS